MTRIIDMSHSQMRQPNFPANDLMIACVAENRPYWAERVYNLAFSLRTFGGNLAQARMCAYFVDGLERRFKAMLQPLDVECRVVDGFPSPVPQTNKLRMLECFSYEEARVLVALDCDIVIVDNFSSSISRHAICGVPASVSPMRPNEWQSLLALLGLRPDTRTIKMINTAEELQVPYLNSGVLFIPAQYNKELTACWKRYILALLTLHRTLNWTAGTWFYLDQIALTCALLASELPLELLDVTHNFPTNIAVHESALPQSTAIRILHYHRHLKSSGHLLPAPTPPADQAIGRFNAALSRRLQSPPSDRN
jgi:hypothetical protein